MSRETKCLPRQTEVHYYHHNTPKRAQVKSAITYAQQIQDLHRIKINYQDIFRTCQVSKTRSYKIIKSVDRTFHNACFKARHLTYSQLLPAAGIDKKVHWHTIRRALSTQSWRKYIACPRSYVSLHHAEQQIEFTRKSLKLRPAKEDYRNILYSNNYNFKSNLYKYHISSNNNGKITAAYYRNHILSKVVKPWLDKGIDFILEEDRDSSHRSNIITEYKKQAEIHYYYNAAGSPDLSPIKNAWRAPSMLIESLPYNNRKDLIADAKEA
ncbi:hypothetical protein GGI42DRAFT_338023 [Trichoderma sp. SZMC 28013]